MGSGTSALRVAIQHCVWPRGLPTMIKCDEPIGMTLHSEQLPHRTRAMPHWLVMALLCSLMVMLNRGCAINGGGEASITAPTVDSAPDSDLIYGRDGSEPR